MKPVHQTNTNIPGGNCFQACVASLLELPLEDVPDFCNEDPANEWFIRLSDWLATRGLGCAYYDCREGDPSPVALDGFVILGVEHEKHTSEQKSRGWCHAVVGTVNTTAEGDFEFRVLFDPNAARYAVTKILDVTWIISNPAGSPR